jgi:hypothetical protein
VRDSGGQQLAHVYFEDEIATKARIAVNIATLPELLRQS